MALREDLIEEDRSGTARRTLAMRIAQRNRLRAERLARLRPAPDPEPPMPAPDMSAPPGSALEEFLRALTRAPERPAACAQPAPRAAVAPARRTAAGDFDTGSEVDADTDTVLGAEAGFEPAPTAVLPFERRVAPGTAGEVAGETIDAAPPPEVAGDCDLAGLDGVGPGLIWALRRAGLMSRADVAALEPEALSARLGPLGRLVPARAWVAAAREAVPD
jgi:predicted flap endonuclease-1-like 5' DNA nuclease